MYVIHVFIYVYVFACVCGIISPSLLLFHYVVCVANEITAISRLARRHGAAVFRCIQKLGKLVKPHEPLQIC